MPRLSSQCRGPGTTHRMHHRRPNASMDVGRDLTVWLTANVGQEQQGSITCAPLTPLPTSNPKRPGPRPRARPLAACGGRLSATHIGKFFQLRPLHDRAPQQMNPSFLPSSLQRRQHQDQQCCNVPSLATLASSFTLSITSSGTRRYLIVLPRIYVSLSLQNRSPSCARTGTL